MGQTRPMSMAEEALGCSPDPIQPGLKSRDSFHQGEETAPVIIDQSQAWPTCWNPNRDILAGT